MQANKPQIYPFALRCLQVIFIGLILVGIVSPSAVSAATVVINPGFAGTEINVVIGDDYSLTFSASGGETPYFYNLTTGSVPGLTLSGATYSGSFTTAGSYPVTVTVEDNNHDTGTTTTTFVVAKRTLTGSLSAANPGAARVGSPVLVTADLSSSVFETYAPTGSVTFLAAADGLSDVSCSASIDATNTSASCYLFFTQAGAFNLSMTYGGDTQYKSGTLTYSSTLNIQTIQLTPQVKSGRNHSCFLAANGSVSCWGLNDNYEPGIQATYSSLSAGNYGTCGIHTDGSLECWSESLDLRAEPAGKYLAVSVYDSYACAINSEHNLICWGDTPAFTVPTTKAKAVAAGSDFACATSTTDEHVFCWGNAPTSPNDAFSEISANKNHICGIKTNGQLACWGPTTLTPPTSSTYTALGSGLDYACALDASNHIACWGSTQNIPVDSSAVYSGLGVGYAHVCALYNDSGENTLACWGQDSNNRAPRLSLSLGVPESFVTYSAQGKAYSQTFTPAGSLLANNYTLSQVSGALPTGITLTSDSDADIPIYQISGTPTTVNAYTFNLSLNETAVSSALPLRLKPLVQSYTITVQSPLTSTTLTSATPTSVTAGEGITVQAQVAWSGSPTLTGIVTIYGRNSSDQIEDQCSTEVSAAGSAACTIYFSIAGTKTFSAAYTGNDFYTGSSSTNSISASVTAAVITPAITAGSNYTCSINSVGRPTCWGNADSNRTTPPSNTYFSNISASSTHVCGRALTGRVACWGWDGYTAISNAPTLNSIVSTASGRQHSCALTQNGSILCWGINDVRTTGAPTGSGYSGLTAGEYHTCAITPSGSPVCWGTDYTAPPADFLTRGVTTALSAGDNYTCAIHQGGALECWGGDPSIQSEPGGTYTALDAGSTHACATRSSDNSLVCWGDSTNAKTVAPSGAVQSVSAGGEHTCAIRSDGTLTCWGLNTDGQAPVLAIAPTSFATLDINSVVNNAVTATGGRGGQDAQYSYTISSGSLPNGIALDNSAGNLSGTLTTAGIFSTQITATETDFLPALRQIRDYTFTVRSNVGFTISTIDDATTYMVSDPVTIEMALSDPANANVMGTPPTGTVTLTTSDNQTCTQTLDAAGRAACTLFFTSPASITMNVSYLGDDLYTGGSSSAPTLTITPFIQANTLVTGDDHTYLHKSNGSTACFGTGCTALPASILFKRITFGDSWDCSLDLKGDVRCFDAANATIPTDAPGKYIDLSVGRAHGCGIHPDGTLACFGDDSFGQLNEPTGTYIHVAAGGDSTCALAADGSLTCWGALNSAPAGNNYSGLSVAAEHACAVASDQSVTCWGDNTLGQSTPPSSGDFVQTASGTGFSCALTTGGQVNCWGDNTLGQTQTVFGTFDQISAADDHACALRSGSSVKKTCWGHNDPSGEASQISYTALTDTEIPALIYWEHHFDPAGGTKPYKASLSGSAPNWIEMMLENNTAQKTSPENTIEGGNETENFDLSPAGMVLYGTPTVPGIYNFTLQWEDSTPSLPMVFGLPQTLTVTGADLSVQISASPASNVLVNNRLAYTITAANTTALTLPAATLSVTLSADLKAVEIPTELGCTLSGTTVSCPITDLTRNSSIPFTISGTAPAEIGKTLTAQATLSPATSDWPEIDPTDNQASVEVNTVASQDVLSDGFDDPALSPHWTGGAQSQSPSGITFLTSTSDVALTLDQLPPHQRMRLSFDLYIIGPWNGSASDPALSNRWFYGLQGQPPILDASFSNLDDANQSYPQVYTAGGVQAPRSGALGQDTLLISHLSDSHYRVETTLIHTGSDLTLAFGSLNLPSDASWGIDNVEISLQSNQEYLFVPLIMR